MVMNCDGWDDSPPADGYCEHGKYVGGCGWDIICGYCEDGISAAEVAAHQRAEQRRSARNLVENLVGIFGDPNIPIGTMPVRVGLVAEQLHHGGHWSPLAARAEHVFDADGWPDIALIPINQIRPTERDRPHGD